MPKITCLTCGGSGEVCWVCDEASDNCECADSDPHPCDDCGGEGDVDEDPNG